MAFVGRMAGAIIAETQGTYYMVGDIKEPCDFASFGLVTPQDRNILQQPYIELASATRFLWRGPYLYCDMEGEDLAQRLVDVFMILRNGSISERLWRLTLSYSKERTAQCFDACWLCSVPIGFWDIVRDQILRCV